MERFMGIMPTNEIEREENFKDQNDLKIKIQAGPNGWTILYADGARIYKDNTCSTEENFNEAYETAVKDLGELKKVEPCKISEE